MKFLKTLGRLISWPWRRVRQELRYRKHLKELRKRDPFIYH